MTDLPPLTPKQLAELPDEELARRVGPIWFGERQPSGVQLHALAGLLQDDRHAPLTTLRMMARVQERTCGTVCISPPRPAYESTRPRGDGKTSYPEVPDYHVSIERGNGLLERADGYSQLVDYPEIGAGPTPLRALVVALAYLDDGLEAASVTRSNYPDRGALVQWGEHQWATDGKNLLRSDVIECNPDHRYSWKRGHTALQLEKATKGERFGVVGIEYGANLATFLVENGEHLVVPAWLAYHFRAYRWWLVVNGDKRCAEVLDDGQPVAYVMPSTPWADDVGGGR